MATAEDLKRNKESRDSQKGPGPEWSPMMILGVIVAIIAGFVFAPLITGIVLGSLAAIVGIMIFIDYKSDQKKKLKESTSDSLTTKVPKTMVNPKPSHAVDFKNQSKNQTSSDFTAKTTSKPSSTHNLKRK